MIVKTDVVFYLEKVFPSLSLSLSQTVSFCSLFIQRLLGRRRRRCRRRGGGGGGDATVALYVRPGFLKEKRRRRRRNRDAEER